MNLESLLSSSLLRKVARECVFFVLLKAAEKLRVFVFVFWRSELDVRGVGSDAVIGSEDQSALWVHAD